MNDKINERKTRSDKQTQGATKVGPCLTDAAPKDRSQRTARVLTAMTPPERMRHQSSRLSRPGGSIRTSMTATATTRILAQLAVLSREQRAAGSIAAIIRKCNRLRHSGVSFNLPLERFDQFGPALPFLLREADECIEMHALNFDADLFHTLDKGVVRQQSFELCA